MTAGELKLPEMKTNSQVLNLENAKVTCLIYLKHRSEVQFQFGGTLICQIPRYQSTLQAKQDKSS